MVVYIELDVSDVDVDQVVTPSADSFNVPLGQVMKNAPHVNVLLDGGAKELEASVANKFVNVITAKKENEDVQ